MKDNSELLKTKPVLCGYTVEQRLFMIDSVMELGGPGGLGNLRLVGKFLVENNPKCYEVVNGQFMVTPGKDQVMGLLQVISKELEKITPMYKNNYTGEIPAKQ